MATAGDLIADSLLEIGALAAGETLGADDGASGLRTLNRMVNAWKAERVFLYGITRTLWNLVSGDFSYTVGSGGDVNTTRPEKIDAIKYVDTAISPAHEIPLRMMTGQDWNERRIPALESIYPEAAYFDPSYPLATINFWPVPTGTTLQGVLYVPTVVSEFAALATAVAFPYGYERFIVKNLALELAPQYGATPSEDLKQQARDSLAVVKRTNTRLKETRFAPDAAMGRGAYDIYSDVT